MLAAPIVFVDEDNGEYVNWNIENQSDVAAKKANNTSQARGLTQTVSAANIVILTKVQTIADTRQRINTAAAVGNLEGDATVAQGNLHPSAQHARWHQWYEPDTGYHL